MKPRVKIIRNTSKTDSLAVLKRYRKRFEANRIEYVEEHIRLESTQRLIFMDLKTGDIYKGGVKGDKDWWRVFIPREIRKVKCELAVARAWELGL